MKKLSALLLSLIMVASLFTGVAFASTPWTAVLNASVTGTVALNQAVTISGSLLYVGTAPAADLYRVRLQHQAPGTTTWDGPGGAWLTTASPQTSFVSGTFLAAHQFTVAGTYRIAFVHTDAPQTALNAQGGGHAVATPALVHTVGTVAALPLVVTPSITSSMWDHNNQISFELTVTQPDGTTVTSPVVTAAYAGAAAVTLTPNAGVYTFTNPRPAVLSGPITITVRNHATAPTMQDTATINMLPRAAFNALVTPGTFAVGTAATINVRPFDALGNGPSATGTFAYAVASVTGPFGTPTNIIITGTDNSFVPRTPRHGGTITVTTRFYSAGHNVLFTDVDTFEVAGVRVERLVTSARIGEATTLRAIVTDAAGNRINNALVTFEVPLGTNMFSVRNADGTFATTATNTISVNGLMATQPRGSSVVNGEYAIDATLRTVGAITIRVQLPTLTGNNLIDWAVDRANWPSAIPVRGALTYAVSLDHTLLAGATDENVRITVLNAGVAVTSGLTFHAPAAPAGMTIGVASHLGSGVWLVPVRTELAGTYTITAANNATLASATIVGEATITAVAPVVTVTPPGGKLTTNFYDIITVTATDPRTNVAVAMPIRVSIDSPLSPNNVPMATATLESAESRITPLTATAWAGTTYPINTWNAANVSGNQFRILARPAAAASRTIDGVVQAARMLVSVGQSGATEPAVVVPLELASATIEVMPHEFAFGRRVDIAVRVLDARGAAMADRGLTITGAVAASALTVPEAGLGLRVTPTRLGVGGVINPSEVVFTVTNDRAAAAPLNQLIHRIAVAPEVADTVAPIIITNAPATTTAATLPVTVTVTDNVSVTGIIFEGAAVTIFAAPTQTFVRTLTLAVGANTFVVLAQDAAGNVGTHSITITRTAPPAPPADTAAPVIEVTVPAVTTEATAVVTVTVRDNVNLAANGIIFDGAVVPGFVTRESVFTRTVTLREGMNIFSVSAQDVAGNVATRVIAVERRTPPAPVSHVITIGRANPAIGLDVPANVRNGRLMVPFRWFGERILEATVDYRVVGAAEIVTLVKGNITVELTLNSTIATVNGTPVSLDVAAFATGGRTLVPARFLAETFGYTVNWNPADDSVTITKR